MGLVTIGADIGQKVDPTAIAVIEVETRRAPGARPEVHHMARHLERLPLQTGYPEVVRRLVEIADGVAKRTDEWPDLFADATGVGTPVVDMLRDAGIQAQVQPVYFTHGDRRTVDRTSHEIKLGKAWLVSRLQALLQSGRLHLPRTAEADALAKELLDYEIHIDQNANDTYGAFKVGAHDDLVTALGLAVQDDGPGDISEAYHMARCSGCGAAVLIPPWLFPNHERPCPKCGVTVRDDVAGAEALNPWAEVWGSGRKNGPVNGEEVKAHD